MKIEFLIIKPEDAYCQTREGFNNLISSHKDIKIAGSVIKFKKSGFSYKLQTDKIESNHLAERFFHLTIEKSIDISNNKEIEEFVELKKNIHATLKNSQFGFRINTIWDDISSHFTTQAYPVINEIENLMRKLIFKFMTMNVGMNWLETATPKEVKNEIDKRIDNRGIKEKLENSLHEADFIHLSIFLFKPYATLSQDKLIQRVRETKKLEELKLKELKEFVPKSNWDRYFSKLIAFEGLNKKWEELYDYRNKVAHNKHLSQGEFERVIELSNEINKKLLEAINKLDTVKVSEDDKKELTDSVIQDFVLNHTFRNFYYGGLNSAFRNPLYPLGGIKQYFRRDPNLQSKKHLLDILSIGGFCQQCRKIISPVEEGDFINGLCQECHSKLPLEENQQKTCKSCGESYQSHEFDMGLCNNCLLFKEPVTIS